MKFQPLRNLVLNVGLRKLRSGIANDCQSPAIFREGAVRRIQAAQQCAENGLLWLLAIGAVKNKVLLAKAFASSTLFFTAPIASSHSRPFSAHCWAAWIRRTAPSRKIAGDWQSFAMPERSLRRPTLRTRFRSGWNFIDITVTKPHLNRTLANYCLATPSDIYWILLPARVGCCG